MLSQYNAIDLERIFRSESGSPPFPSISDREAWNTLKANIDERFVVEIMAEAEEAAREAVPVLPASLYLEFIRNGQRESYQTPMGRRRQMLASLVLAECLEDEGRFLDPILDVGWATCEESSWAYPAHQWTLTDLYRPVIDLGAAMTALDLAETDYLVGERLDPLLGKRIRNEVDRRCFMPYLSRHDHWWLYETEQRKVNNWTAVCNAGVVGAALYLERNPTRLAEIVAKAARSLDDYLATFDEDGGSTEGPGYWDYGFGYYTVLSHLLARRSDGQVNFLAGARLRNIAAYPMKTGLSPNYNVNFSDCDADVRYSRAHLGILAEELQLAELAKLAMQQPAANRRNSMTWALRDLFWQPPADIPNDFQPAAHDWFGGMMWMIARVDPSDTRALVLAAKGGHNGEMHNQNDVGNLIVHYNEESLVADIGRGRYTRAYFGPERYEHLVNSSLGHSVPRPNDKLQEAGREFAATLLEHRHTDTDDTLVLELKDAYPADADLRSLKRRITLHRELPHGWVELVDDVAFDAAPGTFETALTTFGEVDMGEGGLLIRGLRGEVRVTYDDQAIEARVDVFADVDLARHPADVHRVTFAWREPRNEGQIRLEIVPVP